MYFFSNFQISKSSNLQIILPLLPQGLIICISKLYPVVMTGSTFLAKCFIKTNSAGHGNVQRTYHPDLWYHKIPICKFPYFFTYPVMFIPEYKSNLTGKVNFI